MIGGINGKFIDVFTKISALHAKNNFSLAIIAGDLFAADSTEDDEANVASLLKGDIKVPLPTYFALGKNSLPASVIEKLEVNSGEVCENLYFLGKRTTVKTSEGLRIVALGGSLDTNLTVGTSKDKYTPFYSGGDASALKGANTADILITSDWPHGVETGSKATKPAISDDDATAPATHHILSELCSALKPRYHFSTSSFFYEREPFFHPPTDPTDPNTTYPTTRFLSLAPYGNTSKQKWIYAFSLTPSESAPVTIPLGTTASPFTLSKKRSAPATSQASQAEAFSRFASTHYSNGGRPHKRGRRNEPPPGPDLCFFCLSNPNLATHLITSIGSDAYLTTAKGPLLTSTTLASLAPTLACPAHILIIPLAHSPTLASIPDPVARAATMAEMRRYRHALNAMVASAGQGKLGSVCWEVSRGGGVHAHWQWAPLARSMIERGLVEAGMKVEAENEGWGDVKWTKEKLDEEGKQEDDILSERGDVFRVWVWSPTTSDASSIDVKTKAEMNDDKIKTEPQDDTKIKIEPPSSPPKPNNTPSQAGTTTLLSMPIPSSIRFNVQFGRRVLAKLLGLEKRMNWQDCGQSEEEETQEAEAFKEVFKEFDFSLDGKDE